jgi:hypothetical protein
MHRFIDGEDRMQQTLLPNSLEDYVSPAGLAQMINPPQVLPEEPTAVTPHGGFCGGKSQQWLRYPTMPHVRFCAGGGQ